MSVVGCSPPPQDCRPRLRTLDGGLDGGLGGITRRTICNNRFAFLRFQGVLIAFDKP